MLKLNVGLTKKMGEANFGSKGASVNVELELDSGLIGAQERLRERIKQLFALARSSVEEELSGQRQSVAPGHNDASASCNGHANGQRRDGTRRATASQIRAIHAIVDRHRLDLATILQDRFGITDPAELTITEASAMIDGLKESTNGHGGKR